MTPITDEIKSVYEQCKDEVMVGFGLGIPTLSNLKTQYAHYILNKIAIQQIFEGESEWSSNEEESFD